MVILLAIGAILLLASMFAAYANIRKYRTGAIKNKKIFWVLNIVGLALAAASMFMIWPYDTNTKIVGFPFPAAVFQRESETSQWQDYVGPMTSVFVCLNALFWLLIPHLPLQFHNLKQHRLARDNN